MSSSSVPNYRLKNSVSAQIDLLYCLPWLNCITLVVISILLFSIMWVPANPIIIINDRISSNSLHPVIIPILLLISMWVSANSVITSNRIPSNSLHPTIIIPILIRYHQTLCPIYYDSIRGNLLTPCSIISKICIPVEI